MSPGKLVRFVISQTLHKGGIHLFALGLATSVLCVEVEGASPPSSLEKADCTVASGQLTLSAEAQAQRVIIEVCEKEPSKILLAESKTWIENLKELSKRVTSAKDSSLAPLLRTFTEALIQLKPRLETTSGERAHLSGLTPSVQFNRQYFERADSSERQRMIWHEVFHLVHDHLRPGEPSWLREGLAYTFEVLVTGRPFTPIFQTGWMASSEWLMNSQPQKTLEDVNPSLHGINALFINTLITSCGWIRVFSELAFSESPFRGAAHLRRVIEGTSCGSIESIAQSFFLTRELGSGVMLPPHLAPLNFSASGWPQTASRHKKDAVSLKDLLDARTKEPQNFLFVELIVSDQDSAALFKLFRSCRNCHFYSMDRTTLVKIESSELTPVRFDSQHQRLFLLRMPVESN